VCKDSTFPLSALTTEDLTQRSARFTRNHLTIPVYFLRPVHRGLPDRRTH
jgi:hypothetical protein